MTVRNVAAVLVACLLFVSAAPAQEMTGESPPMPPIPTPSFDMSLDHATSSGTIRLLWSVDTLESLPDSLHFELQQASDSLFRSVKTRYTGPDMATYISGLKDGKYYFRVRTVDQTDAQTSPWSQMMEVTVEHHSLNLALTLAGLGGVVFLLTVAVVVYGTRTTERAAEREANKSA
ncbi:hypothetical protein GF420_13945 [candidate division GN15 bacterium]|nr:hypothetical protein [candidate division GN15 bacterium]